MLTESELEIIKARYVVEIEEVSKKIAEKEKQIEELLKLREGLRETLLKLSTSNSDG